MKLNVEKWKEFKVGDLFDLKPTKGRDSTELLDGADISYIGAKKGMNGFMMRCRFDGFEEWVSDGNCIVFVCLGAGSAGYTTYQKDNFIGMSGKTICGYNKNLNPIIGNFLVTILDCERPKYSFGRSWTGDRLKNTIIKLPIQHNVDGTPYIDSKHTYSDEGYVPDWQFMEDYMKSLHHKPLTTKNTVGNRLALNVDEWEKFTLDDVFVLKGGFYNKKPEHSLDGKIPFLASTESNNGVTEFYSIEDIKGWDKVGNEDNTLDKKMYAGNCIAVTVNGSVCNAFYQHEDFTCSHDITAFYVRDYTMNPYLAMFLCTIIMQDKYRWSYGRKPHDIKKFGKSTIKLPIKHNQDGTPFINKSKKYLDEGYVPDWEFMENYIKSLPYGDRI